MQDEKKGAKPNTFDKYRNYVWVQRQHSTIDTKNKQDPCRVLLTHHPTVSLERDRLITNSHLVAKQNSAFNHGPAVGEHPSFLPDVKKT